MADQKKKNLRLNQSSKTKTLSKVKEEVNKKIRNIWERWQKH